ncbi:MAG: hypothetical protein OXB96_01985 [Candidatus Kaiserbacteria bacterium]|nr:hypothetical protein [Candidatus Kaiserbacteria bacterium]
MKPAVPKTIRVVGISTTALLIPVSVLALFALQGVGNDQQIVLLLYIGWALVNCIAVPFMLLGFIMRYAIKAVIYLAVAHLTLSLANLALLLTNTSNGSVLLLAIVALPSLLYVIGTITHKQNTAQQQNNEVV